MLIDFIISESCRCAKDLYTNYWLHPPYLNQSKEGMLGGIFADIVVDMVRWACGDCINGYRKTTIHLESNGVGNKKALKENAQKTVEDIDDVPQISFPIYGNKYITKYMGIYAYIYLVESPGVAFVAGKPPAGTSAQAIILSVFACYPLILFTIVLAALSGIIMWVLVSEGQ